MLGYGSLFFTSEESSYGSYNQKRFNNGVSDSTNDYEDMIPHYLIPSSKPSFKSNVIRKNFMRSSNRTFSNETTTGIGEVTGGFDVALSDYDGTKKILQLFMGLNDGSYGVSDWNATTTKNPSNEVKSMTIYQTYPNNKNLLTKFTGMCINSMNIGFTGNDTFPIISFDFLGKDEEIVGATGDKANFHNKSKVDYAFNDVFPAWTTILEFKDGNTWQQIYMYDFNFTINNNLRFSDHTEDDRTHSNKPVALLREVTGNFNLVGTDEDTARLDDIALLLSKVKNNTKLQIRLTVKDQKEDDYFMFEMDHVYMLSGGVFDNIDYGELRIPVSFIAEDETDNGQDFRITYGS